ncbi:glycoside hydrolase family 32 protein [Corynebacterium sp. 35RC1]|nr:glycoside hydrolase family 32 protein [Corynebacterium sp. 35RC1]
MSTTHQPSISSAGPHRPKFHVSPPQGRLNDPNGMFVDGDTLHVYYQHDPAFPFGAKRTGWGHASAKLDELVWTHHPDALYPDAPYDLHGVYSGGAARDDDGQVYLFYTGNLKVDGERIPSQNIVPAVGYGDPMGGIYRRSEHNPLIARQEPGFTGHFRDPMVTKDPTGQSKWRMVIGAQREDETPAVALYRGEDLFHWEFAGALEFSIDHAQPGSAPDLVPGGFMWECPNLITLCDEETGEDLDVLIMCPQGLAPITDAQGNTHYASSDQCGYLVGRLHSTTFEVLRGFSELDFGHQFYAPQVTAYEQGALLVGWMGLPAQDDTPTVTEEGWVHTLTTPRMLRLRGGRLFQELLLPKEALVHREEITGEGAWELYDAAGAAGLKVSVADGALSLDVAGDVRQCALPEQGGELVIYADGCAVEVTAGGGAVALASAVFAADPRGWAGVRRVSNF